MMMLLIVMLYLTLTSLKVHAENGQMFNLPKLYVEEITEGQMAASGFTVSLPSDQNVKVFRVLGINANRLNCESTVFIKSGSSASKLFLGSPMSTSINVCENTKVQMLVYDPRMPPFEISAAFVPDVTQALNWQEVENRSYDFLKCLEKAGLCLVVECARSCVDIEVPEEIPKCILCLLARCGDVRGPCCKWCGKRCLLPYPPICGSSESAFVQQA